MFIILELNKQIKIKDVFNFLTEEAIILMINFQNVIESSIEQY